ncbi:helix-turn-helix transcriptional regulator [Aquamicrobium defluvii]|uniref:Helix-turn-helix domain-containing protein n=1 Tax=Aquamicrobium defluvii TaxID=69279 RepID=A0A011TED1_9HYPH|nr:hypothetical protein [Aquamicrobium defluvii]EXL10009.1 hypothetical protein BG36_14400 [Aquamicrobium defluvii]EZQ16750.1 hypothetical protein CF98_39920 [Halopseudomonas bauzanensis]
MTDEKPLTLTRQQAAALCGLSPAGFDVWVRKGIVPPAIAGTRRWSRAAVERALGAGPDDVPELSPFEQWEVEQEKKKRLAKR